jgi:hypothetical protein
VFGAWVGLHDAAVGEDGVGVATGTLSFKVV